MLWYLSFRRLFDHDVPDWNCGSLPSPPSWLSCATPSGFGHLWIAARTAHGSSSFPLQIRVVQPSRRENYCHFCGAVINFGLRTSLIGAPKAVRTVLSKYRDIVKPVVGLVRCSQTATGLFGPDTVLPITITRTAPRWPRSPCCGDELKDDGSRSCSRVSRWLWSVSNL